MSDTLTLANKPKKSVALSGVTAGNTAICTVGRTGNDLHYRGYDILHIAEECEFEEIAHLLVHGWLPNEAELRAYKAKLKRLRRIPSAVADALQALPAASNPMDVLRTGVSALGCALPEPHDHNAADARDIADRLMTSMRSMLLLVPLQPQRPADRRADRRRQHRRTLPAPAARAPAVRAARPRHAHQPDPVCRARVQRLDLHRPRGGGDGVRHLLGDRGRDRRIARAQARRRERGRVRDPEAVRHAR